MVIPDMFIEDSSFVHNHISSLPTDFTWDRTQYNVLTKEILGAPKSPESLLYSKTCDVLNNISATIHGGFPKFNALASHLICMAEYLAPKDDAQCGSCLSHHMPTRSMCTRTSFQTSPSKPHCNFIAPEHTLIFVNHPNHPPADHFHSLLYRPDLPGLVGPESLYLENRNKASDGELVELPAYHDIPWHYCETVLEEKSSSNPAYQAATCLYYLLQARPDKPGAYGLAVRRQSYQMVWSDASSIIGSEPFLWTNPDPLLTFMFSLYVPPEGHFTNDPTIRLEASRGDKPVWNITVKDTEYCNCSLHAVASPWGRRTCVYTSLQNNQSIVIKDIYRDDKRRYNEATLIEAMHADGIIPSIVQVCGHETIKLSDLEIKTAPGGTPRMKKRIIMSSTSKSLRKCKSVRDLLMAMFDTIEGRIKAKC